MDPSTNNCHHLWVATIDTDGIPTGAAHCEHCDADPADVLATDGELEMPCGHVRTDEHGLLEHIHWAPIGEGKWKSCDPSMPGWSD